MVHFIKDSINEINQLESTSSQAFPGSARLSEALNEQLFEGILSCGAPELPDISELCCAMSGQLR